SRTYCCSFFQLSSRFSSTFFMKASRSVCAWRSGTAANSARIGTAPTARTSRDDTVDPPEAGWRGVLSDGVGAREVHLLRPLLRERAIVLLDRLAEARRDLVGSRQEQLLVVGVDLLAQLELEALQPIDRRLELLEAARIRSRAERPQLADDRFHVAWIDAGLREHPPQILRVGGPLAELPLELPDLVGRVRAVAVRAGVAA